jgi:hypothetical protein
MNIPDLFVATLDDLESCIASNDDYTVLRASALLRKLFLDGERLVDQANRPYGFKFRFEIADTDQLLSAFKAPGMPEFEFVGIQDALDPDSLPNPPKKTVNRDVFLNTKIQLSKDNSFTVSEIILHQANIEGGIHALVPRTDKETVLSQTEDSLRILGLPAGLRLRVVVLCSKLIEADPKNIAAYYNRGVAYAMADKLKEAIADFDKAIEFDPAHHRISDCYYNRGHTLVRLALLDFEQYVKYAPESPEKESVRQIVDQLKSKGL